MSSAEIPSLKATWLYGSCWTEQHDLLMSSSHLICMNAAFAFMKQTYAICREANPPNLLGSLYSRLLLPYSLSAKSTHVIQVAAKCQKSTVHMLWQCSLPRQRPKASRHFLIESSSPCKSLDYASLPNIKPAYVHMSTGTPQNPCYMCTGRRATCLGLYVMQG